jgi:hypothetical protein
LREAMLESTRGVPPHVDAEALGYRTGSVQKSHSPIVPADADPDEIPRLIRLGDSPMTLNVRRLLGCGRVNMFK